MRIPAIVTAGDLHAARAVYGESKVYLEVHDKPLVLRIVEVLQDVPEITEVWVVGNAERLEGVFSSGGVRERLTKPLHILGQWRNLFENCWETYRRALPGAGPDGRDPVGDDRDFQVLYLSADLPFATPEEISAFIRESQALECDYALGLITRESLVNFLPETPGGVGIEVAYFNMREGRLRQNNLHLARPGNMGARELIEEMYEHRHQQSFGNMISLGMKLLGNKAGGIKICFFYLLIHLGGLADRWGLQGVAGWFRQRNTLDRTERALSGLLQTRFRFSVLHSGGCAIDVDTEAEYDAVQERFEAWMAMQRELARKLYPLPQLEQGQPDVAKNVGENVAKNIAKSRDVAKEAK